VAQRRGLDGNPVWSISCFCIPKGYRRRGVSSALLKHAHVARKAGAPALEAYPLSQKWTHTGFIHRYASTFLRAGFKVVARRLAARPITRIDFGSLQSAPKNSRKNPQRPEGTSGCFPPIRCFYVFGPMATRVSHAAVDVIVVFS
jgi:hypothetical protein